MNECRMFGFSLGGAVFEQIFLVVIGKVGMHSGGV
jgi:hypothetical protein